MKVLLKRFRLNGHTMGFHPQTQKLEHDRSLSLIWEVNDFEKVYPTHLICSLAHTVQRLLNINQEFDSFSIKLSIKSGSIKFLQTELGWVRLKNTWLSVVVYERREVFTPWLQARYFTVQPLHSFSGKVKDYMSHRMPSWMELNPLSVLPLDGMLVHRRATRV